ncbi:MAG: YhbY family RNA-binding protein [Schwartzia sp.]|nr:YhbY family RNA-binding protein [Schwartzia sp. (in: firmicutes)]
MIRKTLSSKQKKILRALGTELEPVVNVGKEGVTPTVVDSAKDAITKRELIKVRVLQNAPEEPKDAIARLTERVDADLVQLIGRNGLLFKRNFKKPQIEFPE